MSSKARDVVDLTDDNDSVIPLASLRTHMAVPQEGEKKRVLPASYNATSNSIIAGAVPSSSSRPNDAYSRNIEVRTSQVKVPTTIYYSKPTPQQNPQQRASQPGKAISI